MTINFIELSADDKYVKILLKKLKAQDDLKYKNVNFLGAFKRALYVDMDRAEAHNIFQDLKKKKFKNNYNINSYYLFFLSKTFLIKKNKKVKIKFNKARKYLIELNFVTKFIAKLYICWKFNYKLNFERKLGNELIYFHSNNFFVKKIFEVHLYKFFKKSKILINLDDNKNKISNFYNNIIICFKNRYKTNNFTFLTLHLKFDIVENKLKKKKIDKAIFFEGDSPDQDLTSQCIKKLGGKTYLFQQGAYEGKIVPTIFRNLNYDYVFTWGDFFKDKFKKFNVKTKIISIGRVGRNNNNNSKIKKNIIVFASQDTKIAGSEIFQKDIQSLFYDFCEWCLKEFKNYKIYFKPHPKYPNHRASKFKKYKNFTLFSHNMDVTELLTDAKFLVSISSTTLFDAVSYNTIPLNFIPWEPTTPNLKIFKVGLVSKNLEDSKIQLNKIINEKVYYKMFFNRKKDYIIKNNFDMNFKKLIKNKIV